MSVVNDMEVVEQPPRHEASQDAAIPSSDDIVLDVEHSAESTVANDADSSHVQDEYTAFTEPESFHSSNVVRHASSEHVIPPQTSPFRRCFGRFPYHLIISQPMKIISIDIK